MHSVNDIRGQGSMHGRARRWLAACAIAAPGALLLAACAATPPDPLASTWPTPVQCLLTSNGVAVSAHRGGPVGPENSLSAMAASIAAGVAILELDVALTRDGAVVLLHDRTLDRTTTGTGPVAAATLAGLRSLRLKDRSGQVTDEPLPTLAEALALARGRAVVSIDFKPASRPSDPSYPADMRALVSAVGREVQASGSVRQVTLIVYSAADAALVQAVAPWATQSISADSEAELAAYRRAGVRPEGSLVFAGVLRDPAVLPGPVADSGLATIVGTLGAPGRRLDDVFAADGDLSEYAGLVRGGAEVIATDAAIAAQGALAEALGPEPLERARACLLAGG